MFSISCLSAAFCSILRVPVSGCSSSIGETPPAKGAISVWPTTSPEGSNSLSRQRGGSRTTRSGLSVIAWGACRARYVTNVKPPVLRCFATPWDFHALGGQTQRLAFAADRLARLCGPTGSVPVEANSVLYPRSLYGGTQIHEVRNPGFRSHVGMMSAARALDVL